MTGRFACVAENGDPKERPRPGEMPRGAFMAIVAQLVRAPVCGTGGRGFKPRRSPHFFLSIRTVSHPMITPWGFADFDAHEDAAFRLGRGVRAEGDHRHPFDPSGPAAGGARLWHYADGADALTDALRLSRGMSYKNAMAGLPLGGGKAVMLADKTRTKTPGNARRLRQGGRQPVRPIRDRRGCRHERRRHDRDFASRPSSSPACRSKVARSAAIPGRTRRLACSWASRRRSSVRLARTASMACTSRCRARAASPAGVARHAAAEGAACRSPTSTRRGSGARQCDRRQRRRSGRDPVVEADVVSPCALGAILDRAEHSTLKTPIIAGGANNQLATPEDGPRLHARGILYAPDYVINAGGIINVSTEYLATATQAWSAARIEAIPGRLEQIWSESVGQRRSGPACRLRTRWRSA